MTRASVPIVSFTAGVWSPRLSGRIDIGKYQNACKTIQNMVVWPHGGASRRPGKEYIGNAKTENVRLIKFQFNTEQTYILELGHLYMRFFRDGAQIVTGGTTPVEIVTPYTSDELYDIGVTQSGDLMYLVHNNHEPRKLTRTGPDTFALNLVSFTGAPAAWGAGNYPNIVSFYQQRTVWTGCRNNPQTIWFSKTASYSNLTSGAGDSDGMEVTLAADEVNAIKWILPATEILIGTTGGEWIIGGGANDALSPTNVRAQRQSKHGSVKHQPLLIGNSGIYISRDKRKIREMRYDLNVDAFASPDLSLLSEHIPRKKVKEIHHIYNPDSIIWVLLETGELAGITYLKDQDVIAWHTHKTDGEIKSICTLEDDEGSELWLAIKRSNGTFIERMKPSFEGEDPNSIECFYVDSGLSYDGSPVSTLNGLAHLEGKTVKILADGSRHPDRIVESGSITLESSASKIVVGLGYEWALEPMDLEGGNPTGLSQSKLKRIVEISPRFERSLGIKYKIKDSQSYEVITRTSSEPLGVSPKLFTGSKAIPMPQDWNREGTFTLFGDDVFPVNIIGIIRKAVQNQ